MIASIRWIRYGVLAAGLVAVALAVSADVAGVGGSPGLGLKQKLLVLAGLTLLILARSERALRDAITWGRSADDALGAGRLALFATVVGLTTGLLEAAVLVIQRFAGVSFLRVGAHVAWMAPVLDAAIMIAIALLLWLASHLWRKLATPRVAAFILFLIAADAVLHRFRFQGRISAEAKWILVIAVATTLARAIAPRLGAASTFLPRIAVAASAAVVVLGTGVALHPEWRERRALGRLPAATSEQVSVLLIILDTVRAASLGLYGYGRPTTPELQRFAASGVTFDQAIAPASWTLPSHATMFTGRYLRELGVDWTTPLDRRHATIAEILAQSGFSTAAFSANVGYVSKDAGLARGFARFEDFVATPGEMVRTSVMLERILTPFGLRAVVTDDNRGRRSAEDINDAFLSWLDRRPRDRPYFAFLNYFDAHAPFYAAPPFDTLFGGPVSPRDLAPWKRYLPRRHINQWRDAYDRSLAYIDAELGRLLRDLERRGSLDSLVVIVTSDHGELLGEHSFMGHATTLYRPVVEVPLVIRGPGVPRGVRVNERVGLRDLPSTILELARVANASPIPGQSLARRWKGATASAPVISELGRGLRITGHYPNAADDLWSAFQEDAHYIVSSSGTEQFYRISSDPAELQNLAREMPAPPELDELRAVIRRDRASERSDTGDWPRARK